MRKGVIALALIVVAIGVWYVVFRKKDSGPGAPKAQPVAVSKYSESFNRSVQDVMNAYYSLAEGLVTWDTATVAKRGGELKTAINNIKLTEIQKDTIIFQTAEGTWETLKGEAETFTSSPTLADKRVSFNNLSNNLYDLLRIVKYDQAKVYLQECPMALNNNDAPGNWLSPSDAVRNPYLGTKDPKYKSSMLECGGPKDTLNFIGRVAQ
jgi:hypothetical protein